METSEGFIRENERREVRPNTAVLQSSQWAGRRVAAGERGRIGNESIARLEATGRAQDATTAAETDRLGVVS